MSEIENRTLSNKEIATLEVLRDQINYCRSEIAAYNSQFLASYVLCAIIAAYATLAYAAETEHDILNSFYLLPSIYFLSGYNLLKYTSEQVRLGAYRSILEKEASKYTKGNFLFWEDVVPKGIEFVVLNGVCQLFFYVPIGVFLLVGFWRLSHNMFWFIMSFFIVGQIGTLLFMGYNLFNVRNKVKRDFEIAMSSGSTD